jgi:short-subunit dehydrogenase
MADRKPVTVITGASAGIGAALALEFAKHGHELVLLARREPQLKALAAAIVAAGGKQPTVITIDLARSDAADRIAEELQARNLEPNYIVNNAGFALFGNADSINRAEQIAMIDLNVRLLTELSLRFVDALARHRGGLLNVASVASFTPGPGMAVYHATKAYVLSLSEALHREMHPLGVRVTALSPGPVATEFVQRAGLPPDYLPAIMARSAEQVARHGYAGLMAGRRVVLPGKPAKICVFLLRFIPRAVVLAIVDAWRSRHAPRR